MDTDKDLIDKDAPASPAESPDIETEKPQKPSAKEHGWRRLKNWYGDHKKWSVPATILLLALLLAAIPFTRYGIAGTFRKSTIELKVVDATANTPVSGATVSIGAASAETDNSGVAKLYGVKAGHRSAQITKKYYQSRTIGILAPILKQKAVPAVQLTATGRQVKIEVTNLISKMPLENVDISVAGTSAKTDKAGAATVVLPPGQSEQKASLSLKGYNDAQVAVKVSDSSILTDQFGLTPAGQVYFLSKLSGKIDVVKTNLDGTGRQTVLAGTGNEDDQNTVLLASRSWQYLALLSQRAGDSPVLYLINTADDSLTTIDSGNADFNLAGWQNGSFIYTATRRDVQLWQTGRQQIKSYNPQTKKLTVLDQTTASGTDNFHYASQLVGDVYAYGNQVFYIMNWTAGLDSSADLASKQATLNSINTDGSGKKAIRSFAMAAGTDAIDITLEDRIKDPGTIELKFTDGTSDNFYEYSGGQVKNNPGMTARAFYSAEYSTYLLSPSGSQTFWSEPRDGKNTLFVGDGDGQNGKQIATLSDYTPYGWYTDDYLLVSKDASELYAISKDGQNVVKISDYHKPDITFQGYGGGYGGL